MAGQQKEQRTAQTVNVGPRVGTPRVRGLLRRDVLRRAHEGVSLRQTAARLPLALHPRQPKVKYLDLAARVDHEVLRLDVAMDHALLERMLQAQRRLTNEVTGIRHRQRT